MSRRSFFVLAVWLLACAGARAADGKTKVLLLGKDRDHPYTEHEYMTDCELLARCLRQTPGVEAVVSNGWPRDPAVLKGVTAIALYTRKGGNIFFASPARRQVEELLKQGVGLTVIHWSTGADRGPQAEPWLRAVGGWFDYHGKQARVRGNSRYTVTTAKVHRADPSHPVCRGWKDYTLREEYYLDMVFRPDIKPVITVTVKGKDYPWAWVYERPGGKGGRTFGFLGGHFHASFGEKPFRQAIINGILWTARRDVPGGGAPCRITARDMELPPDMRP
jgi:type 1 glutamine amidotransferase